MPVGLSEDVIRMISAKKNEPEWLLEWRLKAYRHWLTMTDPLWHNVKVTPVDYQQIAYYSAPKPKKILNSLDEVDPEMLAMFDKLGISLAEQKRLSNVAVDAVFDSVSVATTFKGELARDRALSSARFPRPCRTILNWCASTSARSFRTRTTSMRRLTRAVFTDGSFCYIPKGVRCPMELSTYFRINAANTGQFERTLIIADEGAYV